MEILERAQFATETDRGPEFAIDKLMDHASNIIGRYPAHALAAIGISCGGPLDPEKGLIKSPPNLPGWDDIPITQMFLDKFKVPVALRNDANACALAEWKYGAGQGTQNMIFLTFGTGLGAGLILDGKVYPGTNGMAGEIGHIRMADDGPEGYGKTGSFEGFCSGAGIAKLGQSIIRAKMENGESVSCCKDVDQIESITAKELAEAAKKGDKTAIEILEISAKYLGQGLSILIDLLNPERIVIGGNYARYPDLFGPISRNLIEQEALSRSVQVCEVVPALLGDEVGDYAAITVALLADIEQNEQVVKV